MTDAKLLQQVRSSEKSGRVARRLDMLIVLFNMKGVFAMAAATYSCDPRTVALWYGRMPQNTDVFGDIRSALADMPRSGRPTKTPQRLLAKAEAWCRDRAFTTMELCDYMEDISGVRLSLSQTRRYAKKWGYSRKKTSPMHVNRTAIEGVESWQENITCIVAQYAKLGYAIATQDESNFKDAVLSVKYWAKVGLRIFMTWSGGHQRFSMFCTMAMDGRYFFNHTTKTDTTSFLEHIEKVYEKVGKMVLFLDRAPWHTSAAAKEFFESHDIIIVWYPVGHPYLNPVEEVWSVLKRAVVHSVRYADTAAHLTAVYGFIGNHEFDYCFFKFWKQKPSEGVMRPFVRSDGQLDHAIEKLRVNSAKKRCRCKKR